MKVRVFAGLTICAFMFCLSGIANAYSIFEGFEDTETIFTYSSYGSVPFEISNTEEAHSGNSSFKVSPSSCGASCFDSYRVDLLFDFTTPTLVEGIGFWAKEGSTGRNAWGGKIKVSYDLITTLDYGIVGNNSLITDVWEYLYIPINDEISSLGIHVRDVTSVSSMWIDDVQIEVVPEPSTFLLLGGGLVGLVFVARRRKQE